MKVLNVTSYSKNYVKTFLIGLFNVLESKVREGSKTEYDIPAEDMNMLEDKMKDINCDQKKDVEEKSLFLFASKFLLDKHCLQVFPQNCVFPQKRHAVR